MMCWVKTRSRKQTTYKKRMEEHAKALWEGRQHGYSLHPMKELCWLVLDMIPSLSDEMHMWHSAVEGEWGEY